MSKSVERSLRYVAVSLFAVVFAISANATDWFNGGLSDAMVSGGSWSQNAAIANGTLTVDGGDAVEFTATEAKGGTDELTIDTTVAFTAFDEVPEVPTGAKGAIAVVTTADGLAYYGLVKDSEATPAANKWVVLEGTPTTSDSVNVKILFKDLSTAPKVKYMIGSTALCDYTDIVVGSTTVSAVGYKGTGTVTSLVGSYEASSPAPIVIDNGLEIIVAQSYWEGKDLGDLSKSEYLLVKEANGLSRGVNYVLGKTGSSAPVILADDDSADIAFDFSDITNDMVSATGVEVKYVVGGVTNETAEAAKIALNEDTESGTYQIEVVLVDEKDNVVTVAEEEVSVIKKDETVDLVKPELQMIAVPFADFADEKGQILLKYVLKKTNLSAGDKLYCYNKNSLCNDVFKLTADTDGKLEWVGQVPEEIAGSDKALTAPDASEYMVTAGDALWLERTKPNDGPIFFYGSAEELPAEKTVTPGWNLVARPGLEPFALANLPNAVGDQIVVDDGVNAPVTFDCTSDGWGYYQITTTTKKLGPRTVTVQEQTWTKVTNEVLPIATGFWYVNNGETSKTITWGGAAQQDAE